MRELVVGLFLVFMGIVVGIGIGIGIGLDNGFTEGQISIASGQTKCELKANVDKTTKWECTQPK